MQESRNDNDRPIISKSDRTLHLESPFRNPKEANGCSECERMPLNNRTGYARISGIDIYDR